MGVLVEAICELIAAILTSSPGKSGGYIVLILLLVLLGMGVYVWIL